MGAFSILPCCFFAEAEVLWSVALVSHREGVPEVSVGPLICVLHCPNSLLSLVLSLSVSLRPARSLLAAGRSCVTIYFTDSFLFSKSARRV